MLGYIEKERKSRALPPVGYEVGTEETAGGLTDPDAFGRFLEQLIMECAAQGLPKPDFIVGQTGTLIKMKGNVGIFDADKTRTLASIAKNHGVAFKEHNADFLPLDVVRW